MSRLATFISLLLLPLGCGRAVPMETATPRPPAATPRYVPPVDRYLSSTLLTFESGLDATFVDARDVRIVADPERPANRAHRAASTRIKFGALVRGREFPGPWDLVGLRLRNDSAVEVSCDVSITSRDGNPVSRVRCSLPPRQWKGVWLEIGTNAASQATADDDLQLRITSGDPTVPLLIDDILLAQSRRVVSESLIPKTGERWQVRRSGLRWQAIVNGSSVFELPAAPFVVDGFGIAEAGPTRVVFRSAAHTIAIDRTGRLIEDGVARLDPNLMKVGKAIAENASPAHVEIIGDHGRIERTLPGDRDNDGYDDSRGCYTVRAGGDRVTIRLTKQRATVRWPVIEVLDLPPGEVSVFMEGELVPWALRLPDGRVVAELPIELERPVEVQFRVK